ncbi:MAG TPA: glycosyltransferase 87 family protein [Streptosporangiaceae bacterium]|nr:glycosyltransferase 87 family protein [Streptosporangiaceae bacterium]
MAWARPDVATTPVVRPARVRARRRALVWAAAAFALALGAWVADIATHPIDLTLGWFDLNIYNHAGLITRHATDTLYSWHFRPGVQYLYTPFAALGFAAGSLVPWAVLKWLMTGASLAAMIVTVWVTFGQLGWAGRRRTAAVLGVSALALWSEPVLRSLQVGQIELLLMALIAWDMCQPDGRRWKGVGVGVAAGIKLVPLIFIPYLLLAGKVRQAAVALGVFAATAVIGLVALPHDSVKWWLTGYFLHAGNFEKTSLGSLLNQSLLAMITRTPAGAGSVTSLWLLLAALFGCLGLGSAAVLARTGRLTAGWVTCAVTGVLISPISWDNHWVWIVPVGVLLVDAAVRARGWARAGYVALIAALAAVFLDWPTHWSGRLAFVPHGLVGFDVRKHPMTEIFHLDDLQLISWNLFVLGGLAVFAGLVIVAARIYRHEGLAGLRLRRVT